MAQRFALLLLFACLLLTSVGCQSGFSQRASEGKENTFRYPIVTNPTTLDPFTVQDGDTIDLLMQVFEGLVTWNEHNEIVGLLAESWEITDGGRGYVFKLKPNVKFHDGSILTAHDVKWSWERALGPNLESPVAKSYMDDVVGAMALIEGRASELRGVTVIDDLTLKVMIDMPRPYFLGKLTYPCFYVVPKDKVPSDREIARVEEMIGTGPFRAESYEPDQLTVLAAFDDYHLGRPKIDRIERPVIKDAVTRLNKFRAGEIDLCPLERQDLAAVEQDEKLKGQLHFFDRAATWYIGMAQTKNPVLRDRRVRQALMMAVDREQIVKVNLGGVNHVANSILPIGVMGYRPDAQPLPFDVARARELLAEAGYPNGEGFPTLELAYREERPDIRIVAEAAASMLGENLGIRIRLRAYEWVALLDKHTKGDLELFHMRWGADYLDPQNFLSLLMATYPYGAENTIGYSNAEFDRLCREADSLMDPARRKELYAQAEDIVLQEGPWIPIYFQRDIELISPRVRGVRHSLFGHLPHINVSLEN